MANIPQMARPYSGGGYADGEVTVIDRILALGYQPDKDLTWPVGSDVREQWIALNGSPPIKRLRRKTNGHGSHYIAGYPKSFVPTIDRIIEAHANGLNMDRVQSYKLFG